MFQILLIQSLRFSVVTKHPYMMLPATKEKCTACNYRKNWKLITQDKLVRFSRPINPDGVLLMYPLFKTMSAVILMMYNKHCLTGSMQHQLPSYQHEQKLVTSLHAAWVFCILPEVRFNIPGLSNITLRW